LALAVPLSRSTSRVGGGSAFFVRQLELMKTRILANVGCWLPIVPLVAASILYCFHLWHIWGTFTDGNDYFDPLVFILSYLTPIACFGVVGFFVLRRYGLAQAYSVSLATTLFAVLTLALCAFGIWLFHGQTPPFRLSYFVWWFMPFRLVGL